MASSQLVLSRVFIVAKILVVEDDSALGFTLKATLQRENHIVELVEDGQEANERLKLYPYEIIILDWNLPSLSGIEIARNYRSNNGKAPILMLTANNKIENKEEGFGVGADDYLTKPFDKKEVIMRVNALLRRPKEIRKSIISLKGIEIDTEAKTVMKQGKAVRLTSKEYSVLEFLITKTDHFITVTDLHNTIWSSESDSSELAVRQCITRLRKKLDSPGQPPLISTQRGRGYSIQTESID